MYGMMFVTTARLTSTLNWLFSDGLMVISDNPLWKMTIASMPCTGASALVTREKIFGK
ncbi:Uncharacterised protein [Enterobacter cloacae]|nr:Uncharacterised protein [Enterobacter cloacae]